MNSFLEPALEIVKSLLEAEDDEMLKDVGVHGEEGFWEQIDGDFGNPWLYGGSWYNPVKAQILQFDGIEDEKEIEPDTVELPATMLAKLPPEQPDWQDNRERDRIIQQYQVARAEFLNNRKRHKFWLIEVPDEMPDWLKRPESEMVIPALGVEAGYEYWPLPNKLIEIGRYVGYNEIGYSFHASKLEAEKFLRTTL